MPALPQMPPQDKILHIETTNRCVIACPACPRTVWRDMLKRPVAKQDLDIDLLEKFLDCDGGRKFEQFFLCGDYGDSIYYPDLIKLIQRFRDRVSFCIVTNGSRQTEKFWNNLASVVSEKDIIMFSIDGLEDTNHLYRVNSDWASIMQGLDIMVKSPAQVHWKTIVFDFNYNQLDHIEKFANSRGATFHAEKTHRYGNENLKPPEQYIELNHTFDNSFIKNYPIEIEPRCESEAKIITTDGYLSPCDWMRNPKTFYKSQLWKHKDRWLEKTKMENNTYDQAVLAIRDWEKHVVETGLAGGPVDVLCKMLCRKGCNQNKRIGV